MRGLEPTENGREETESERKIRLYDYLEDTNKIIEKIQNLSRKNRLTIEEKVNLFEEYLNDENTGDTIITDTIYEGYPIGMYLISIRSELNDKEKAKKYSKEILEKLENLALLDDRIESTIDEKIDRLIQFVQDNSELWELDNGRKTEISVDKFLGEKQDKEKRKELIKQLELANKDYDYIRTRKSKGKLAKEDIERLKDAGVGRVFGDTKMVELQKQEFVDKYEIKPKVYDLIIKNYGSKKKKKKIYVEALIRGNIEETIDKKILNNCKLVKTFDISSPDWKSRNNEFTELIVSYFTMREKVFIKYENLDELLLKSGDFTEREKKILTMAYGLNGEKKLKYGQIEEKIGLSRGRAGNIVGRCIKKIVREKQLDLNNRVLEIDYDLQKKIMEEYFKDYDIFISKEPTSMDEGTKNKLTKMLLETVEKTKKRNEQLEIIDKMSEEQLLEILKARFGEKINSTDLNTIQPFKYSWNTMYREIGENNGIAVDKKLIRYLFGNNLDSFYKECIDTEVCQVKIAEFMIENATNSELTEVGKKEKLEGFIDNNEYLTKEKKSELKEMLIERTREAVKEKIFIEIEDINPSIHMYDITIEELDISFHLFNCLKRAGFNTVGDFIGKSEEDISFVRNLGKKGYYEVIEKLKSMGLELEDGVMIIKENIEQQIDDKLENMRMQIEEEINSSEVITEEEKESLRKKLDEKYKEIRGVSEKEENANKTDLDKIMEMTIEELDLSIRAYNGVKRFGINTVKQLASKTENELKKIRNLGPRSVEEMKNKLHSLGLKLKGEEELEEASVIDNSYSSLEESIDDIIDNNSDFEIGDNLDNQEESTEQFSEEFNETEENQEEIEQENEESNEEQIQSPKEQKAIQLENIIQELKQAYITLGQRDKELQVAIQERVEELERVRSEKITTEEKLHKLEKIVEENRQFFEELGELESFEEKIQNTLNELEGKRQEEKGIEETIEDLRKQQEEVQNQKEEIKKQIHDISQEL